MLKNRPVIIAIISLAVIGSLSTVIFLQEFNSISDKAEAENTKVSTISLQEFNSISDKAEAENTKVSTIQYDFPLHGESFGSLMEPGPITGGKLDFTISNLPKIGETAEIKMNYTQGSNILEAAQYYYSTDGSPVQYYRYIIITDNFEFVGQDDVITHTAEANNITYHSIRDPIDPSNPDVNISLSATIRAVSEGMGEVNAAGGPASIVDIDVHVGENETLLKEDYLNLHPEMRPQQTPPPPQEPIKLCYGRPCLPHDGISHDAGPVTRTPLSEIPKEEFRAFLEEVSGLSDEEIEEIIQKEYPDPDASTQSFFLPSAYATNHMVLSGYR